VGKWFRQILQGEHSLFRLSLPFRVRLFNVLALVGGMISLINGISSYANNQDSVILGLNLGIAVLSFVLLFYAYKSGRYQFCYVVTTIMIFLMMFPYLFFKSGGYKGGMVSFYIFGILFTVFMLEGKVMFFTAFMEMVVYIATIMIAYQNPQMVVWFSSEKEVVMDLLIGFCASSISVAAVMYLHFRMYNKQQEILEEARIEAQSANKAKSAFLANMGHEIRTPINVMLGMNEMILRESESEEIRQYAKSIERSGGYLISLINNILDISRIESGKMEIEEGKYELRQLLDEVMLIAEKQAEQKSLKMNLIFDKTLPAYLIGDVIHIKQILLNLINNAVKYTKEGQIDIKVSKNEEETKLIFEVKDTGIGIKEENLPVLFDAFMRVDSKKNKKIKGTGLGLAIAKQLVEQMGGMIWVESVYGKGSSFFVQLPMKKVSDGKISNVEWKETDERKRRSFVAPQAKILIVDDNEDIREVLGTYVAKEGFEPVVAKDGFEALDLFKKANPAVVLLDVMMPGMDGYKVCEKIREQSDVPIILVTAKGDDYDRVMGLDIGADDYIVKPFNGDEVMARVRAVLRRMGRSGATEEKKILNISDLTVNIETYTVYVGAEKLPMTKKEVETMWILAGNPSKVFTRDNLLDSLWGQDYFGDSRTVDSHIKRLRAKLDKVPHPNWEIKTIWGLGYKFELTV